MDNLLTQKTPTALAIAQAVGITGSVFLLGSNVCLSVVGIPAAMQAPAPLAVKQWHTIFTRGGAIARPLAIVSALATGYLAYNQDPKSTPFRLNALATILLPSIVPFTLLAMAPTNDKLLGKKDELATASLSNKNVEAFAAEGETVHELMDKWASLNMARAMLDVDEDRSSVVVVEAISLVVEEASVEVSVMVGEFGEETSSVEDTDALAVISLDAEEDVSEETTVEEDDELTASGVTVGSDEIGVILLDVSAELYDVDDISVEDEDDVGSTEEVTMTNDALCWVGEGAALEEDTALQSPNSFWQVSGAQ
ncbi:unnamed protein product [Alternaria alternata]